MILALIALLALTRAELVERMRAPVVTQSDGLVRVFADCPEPMRREFQAPVARFAADVVAKLYRGSETKPVVFRSPCIVIHIGESVSNDTRVLTRVVTNEGAVVSRIRLPAPGAADLDRFRLEVARAFGRSVKGVEWSEDEALATYRRGDPEGRIADSRMKLERWLDHGEGDDEEAITLMRKVLAPGSASRRDVLVYASRCRLYPESRAVPFCGRYDVLSYADAVKFAAEDPAIRAAALEKAKDAVVFGAGRGKLMNTAAALYSCFLAELAKGEKSEPQLMIILESADTALRRALEEAEKSERNQEK